MSPDDAIARLNIVLSHAWMIRTFLKHAEEIQDSEEMLEVPRTLYDAIRAVEPAFQRGDRADYLRRLKGKLPKLRKASDYFQASFRAFSPHTNFEMAALSLRGVVQQMEEILDALNWDEVRSLPVPESGTGESSPPDPLDDIEIPEV
jgi:hypothetical protein